MIDDAEVINKISCFFFLYHNYNSFIKVDIITIVSVVFGKLSHGCMGAKKNASFSVHQQQLLLLYI